MNPIPPEAPKSTSAPSSDAPAPSLADTLANKRKSHAAANRRASAGPATWAYPVLLILSTLVAGAFCVLYITKPVIATLPESDIRFPDATDVHSPAPPAEPQPAEPVGSTTPASATHAGHEETNLRVQHVLDASTQEGDLSRIVLDVPVIYASRHLRWTDEEVANARAIHARLLDYHEQSRHLRQLGTSLHNEWNELIERSIPAADLRADSPSLPANQEDAVRTPRPDILDTTEAIEIQPSGE